MSDSIVMRREARLQVVGEMNIYGAIALKERLFSLASESGADIELDLSGVTALDTAGVQIMLMLRRHAQSKGVAFRLMSASTVALQMLELCGLRSLISQSTLAERVS